MIQAEQDGAFCAENGASVVPSGGPVDEVDEDGSAASFEDEDVVFVMEVTQKGGLCDYIQIRKGDDPEELAREFVRTHKLSEKYVKRMADSLRTFYNESMRRHVATHARFEADSVSSRQSSRTVRSFRSGPSRTGTLDRGESITRITANPDLREADSDSVTSGGPTLSRDGFGSRESMESPRGARIVPSPPQVFVTSPLSNGGSFLNVEQLPQGPQNGNSPPFYLPSPLSPPAAPRSHVRRTSSEESRHERLDTEDVEDEYDEVVDGFCEDEDESEVASKAAFERAKSMLGARAYSAGYLSDPEILTSRIKNGRRRGLRRKKIGKRHIAVYNQLHQDAEVRQLRLARMRQRSERDLQRQMSQWRMTDSSKQWLRHQPDTADTTERLYNEFRLMQERREESARARAQETLPSWNCPKCGKENAGKNETCMTVVGVKRALMDQRSSSWVYSRKLDDDNAIYCGQPRPVYFRPTLVIVPDAAPQPQRYGDDIFNGLYAKRDSREQTIARLKEVEEMNNPITFRPTMNARSEALVKRRRQISRNNSVATSLTIDVAEADGESQSTATQNHQQQRQRRPTSAPARGRQRLSHFDMRDYDASLFEVLYKDASDREVRLQQLREALNEPPTFRPQLLTPKSASQDSQSGEHDVVFERLHQAALHLKKHREELERIQNAGVDPQTGHPLFKPKLVAKQMPRPEPMTRVEEHLFKEGERLRQQRAEREKALQEEEHRKTTMRHIQERSLKITEARRRKDVAEVYQSLLWSAEYKRFMQRGKERADNAAEPATFSSDGDDFPMDEILANWQESSLDTELADPSMLRSVNLAALVGDLLKQFQPQSITFAQFEEHLCKAISERRMPWGLFFERPSCGHSQDEEAQHCSFHPTILKQSTELAWRSGRGSRKIEEVLLAAGEKYKAKAAQRKEAYEREQAVGLTFKPTLVTDNMNIEHRYPNERSAEKFMEQIALLDRTREMLAAQNSPSRSSIGSASTIVASKSTVAHELKLTGSANSLLSFTLSATADPSPTTRHSNSPVSPTGVAPTTPTTPMATAPVVPQN